MSSGADCTFIQQKDGSWIYSLQDWPYGDWDEYTDYGPFPTYSKAVDHLDAHHQNPGGWSVERNENFHCEHKNATPEFMGEKTCNDCGAGWWEGKWW